MIDRRHDEDAAFETAAEEAAVHPPSPWARLCERIAPPLRRLRATIGAAASKAFAIARRFLADPLGLAAGMIGAALIVAILVGRG